MLSGISTVANLNQDNPHAVQGQMDGPHGTSGDVVEGKVNPVESLGNLSSESDLHEEAHSEDMLNRSSGEERIIDLLG
jgi:hypothetical protein